MRGGGVILTAFAVLCDVVTGIRRIGGVNASSDTSSKDSSIVSDEPLGRVESQNIDDAKGLHVEVNEGFGKGHAVLPIARPSPELPL